MFAQNLESVNISFTKFEYFQALFQVRFSSVLSNDMNELLSYRPTGPWALFIFFVCSSFLFVIQIG